MKKQKNIRFSGNGVSHQNGAAECNIKMIVTKERTTVMHAALIFIDDTLYNDLWTM